MRAPSRERESPPDDCCRLRFALLSSPSVLLSKFASRQRESVDYGVVGGGDGCTVPRASRKNWEGRNIDRGRRSVSGIKNRIYGEKKRRGVQWRRCIGSS